MARDLPSLRRAASLFTIPLVLGHLRLGTSTKPSAAPVSARRRYPHPGSAGRPVPKLAPERAGTLACNRPSRATTSHSRTPRPPKRSRSGIRDWSYPQHGILARVSASDLVSVMCKRLVAPAARQGSPSADDPVDRLEQGHLQTTSRKIGRAWSVG